MRIITRFLIWLLDLTESKIAKRNIELNEALKWANLTRENTRDVNLSLELSLQQARDSDLRNREELYRLRPLLDEQRTINRALSTELYQLREAARKSDTTAIVSSDNVRAMQDKFNQLKRHGRALRYSIGKACLAIETMAAEIGQTRHACEHEAAQLWDISRQMRLVGCIPPEPGQLKPEDFISNFHPTMLDDNPVDAFKPAREIVGTSPVKTALDGVRELLDEGRVKLHRKASGKGSELDSW